MNGASRCHSRHPSPARSGPILIAILCTTLPIRARAETAAPPLRFAETRIPTGGAHPFAVVAVDLNEDGKLDLAVTDVGKNALELLLAVGDGTFRQARAFPAGKIPRGLVAADVNADGHADLVVAGGQKNSVELLLGDGAGAGVCKTYRARIAPFNVAVADLDGDGHLDVAVANESNIDVLRGKGEVSLLYGDGAGGFRTGPVLRAGSNPADVKAADLNGDGRTDLAVVNWESHDVSLFFAQAGGGFSAASNLAYGGGAAYALAVADLDGDAKPDLIVGDAGGEVLVLRNRGGGSFAPATRARGDRGLRSLAVADFDGDGRIDVATANTGADSVSVLLNQGKGAFAPAMTVAAGKGPRWVSAADVNADGKVDLVVANGLSADISILLNQGRTGAERHAAPTRREQRGGTQ